MGRPAKDLTGQQFGNLIVLERAGSTADGHAQWKCQCQCENKTIVYVASNQLQRKKSTGMSCGCMTSYLESQARKKCYIDLTGQRFGKLVALQCIDSINSKNSNKLWRCKCDCGNDNFITTSQHLRSGNTQSCGCLKSKGEEQIALLLMNYNIPFQTQYQYKDCIINTLPARFDFYLPKQNRLIEFDGIQHFEKTNGWNDEANYKEVQKSDTLKNEYAKQHNIPLVRIPYWERDNITLDMIMGDKYLVN